jgi:transglutaminase-like putative cysteine protease
MRFEILHRTHYDYAAPVRESFNEVHLQPVSNEQQTVESFLLKVLPATRLRHYTDFYSNCVHHFEIPEPHTALTVESNVRATTKAIAPLAPDLKPWPLARIMQAADINACYEFLQASRYVDTKPETWRLALDAADGADDVWQAALALTRFVHSHLAYESCSTTVHTHMRDVLQQRRGVCQDFAHVMLGLCRGLKIPARYVSGYLLTETASATHAWTEVFVPTCGWRALDPTHNRQVDETYLKLAVGRDYADVAPITGNYKGTEQRRMTVEVKISLV